MSSSSTELSNLSPLNKTSAARCAPPSPPIDTTALRRVQLRRKLVLAVCVVIFVGVAAVTRPLFTGTIWRDVLGAVGLAAIVAAIVGRGWCSLYIGGRKTREIVTRGPYSISRNPLYLFSFLAAFGLGAQTGSLVLSAAAVLLAIGVFRQTVLCEEAWLRAAFGVEYESYLAETPRFWPRWENWRDEPRLEVSPARFATTVLDGSVLLLILPVAGALSIARDSGLIPTLLTLP